jgi:hypothetical protein
MLRLDITDGVLVWLDDVDDALVLDYWREGGKSTYLVYNEPPVGERKKEAKFTSLRAALQNYIDRLPEGA